MDTDNLYFALIANKLDDVVKPQLAAEFNNCKKDWLAWDTWSNRTPGLFKLVFEGHRATALCNKCYFVEGARKLNTRVRKCRHDTTVWHGRGTRWHSKEVKTGLRTVGSDYEMGR